jgi:hypothetical protein
VASIRTFALGAALLLANSAAASAHGEIPTIEPSVACPPPLQRDVCWGLQMTAKHALDDVPEAMLAPCAAEDRSSYVAIFACVQRKRHANQVEQVRQVMRPEQFCDGRYPRELRGDDYARCLAREAQGRRAFERASLPVPDQVMRDCLLTRSYFEFSSCVLQRMPSNAADGSAAGSAATLSPAASSR